jgi:hypothetical protein
MLLATAEEFRWHPGIGDPTWIGWLTVGAYAFAVVLAWMAYRSAASDARRLAPSHPYEAANERLVATFWLLAFAMVAALGINKQLDLQSLFTQVLRDAARVEGWYDERRRYQFAFVVAISGTSAVIIGTVAWIMRVVLDRVWLAVVGLGALSTFVVIRAASFHHVDAILNRLSHRGIVVFELLAIAITAAGAWRSLQSRPVTDIGGLDAAPAGVRARDSGSAAGTP